MIDRLPPLVARIVREHRRILTILGVGLLLNVLAYGFGVYPLSQRVANVEQRNSSALRTLDAARKDHGAATGTLAGKDRATTELSTFYTSVLPRDLASARRLTHLRIAQLAREHGLKWARATSEPAPPERNSTLTRLKTDVSLTGPTARFAGSSMRSKRHRNSWSSTTCNWPRAGTRATASS